MRLGWCQGGLGGNGYVPRLSDRTAKGTSSLLKHAWIIGACAILFLSTTGCEKDGSILVPTAADAPVTIESPVRPDADSSVSTVDREKVFFFGTVTSTDGDGLMVEIEQPKTDLREGITYWAEVLPGRGIDGNTIRVTVDGRTVFVPEDGGLESLEPGTPIMVGGLARGGALSGHFIVDLRQAERYSPSPAEEDAVASIDWRVTEGVQLADHPELALGLERLMNDAHAALDLGVDAADSAQAVKDFPGNFAGPSWVADTGDLGIPLLLIPYVELSQIVLTVALGGATYNFPFSFQAHATAPLFVGQTGDLEFQVAPQGRLPYTWSYGLGFNIAFHIKVCFVECDNYVYDFNLLSTVIQTADPAPIPGEMLDVEAIACPSWDVSMGVIDLLGIEFCEEQQFEGDFFYSDVEIQNSSWDPCHYDSMWFNGVYPQTRSVRPITNPLNVIMDQFHYHPSIHLGAYARTYMFGWTIYQFPTIPLGYGDLNLIPTDQSSCDWYGSWLGTCGDGQPSSVELTVPAIPVVTSISSTPNPSRFGEMVTVQALVRGANGPDTGPKEVTFYDGDTPLATVPIDGADIATFQISALSPCKHTVGAEYIGYDGSDNAYPSRRTLAQVVTGDADWTRREGYWQHQCNGDGETDFDSDRLECYLSIIDHMSTVFGEVRTISTADMAFEVLFMEHNGGSAIEELDRELLVAWLNCANGGIAYDEPLDSDKDGVGDRSFLDLVLTAEAVRLNPNSTERQVKEQTRILHDVIQTQMP